jgi:hypothetical protein
MRRNSQISIYSNPNLINEFYYKYKRNNDIQVTNLDTILIIDNIYTDTNIYHELMVDIELNNVDYGYAEAREYTKEEIKNAEYFHVNVPYPWEHDQEKDAKYYGTQYKYPNGIKCECQREQNSDLLIDTQKIGKKHFIEIIPEYIVSEFAMKVIQDAGFTGCIFQPAMDYKNRETSGIFQLIVTNILPPISKEIRIETLENPNNHVRCRYCLMKTYLRSEMIYNKEDLLGANDFNLTHERFDNYMNRKLVVSSRVREVFNKNKIRVYGYEPVSLI